MRSKFTYTHVYESLAYGLRWRFQISAPAPVPSASWTPKPRHLSPFRRQPCRPPSPGTLPITPGYSGRHCIRHLSNDSIDDDLIMIMYWILSCIGALAAALHDQKQPDCSIYIWEPFLLLARRSLYWF